MDPIASAKISTPIQPCPLQKSPKNHPHPSLLSPARPTTGAPAVRANPNPSATDHTKALGFHPFPTPPKKTAPCISAPANKAPTASSATARTRRSPEVWWRDDLRVVRVHYAAPARGKPRRRQSSALQCGGTTSLGRACARETTAPTEQRPPMWRDDLRVVRLSRGEAPPSPAHA